MLNMKFYKCKSCNLMLNSIGEGKELCSDAPFAEIVANTVDAAKEKHVPQYEVVGNIVNVVVGDVIHPMQEVHFIEWIMIETKNGNQIKYLKPNQEPKASFALVDGDELVSVYAYCNLHGLWKN